MEPRVNPVVACVQSECQYTVLMSTVTELRKQIADLTVVHTKALKAEYKIAKAGQNVSLRLIKSIQQENKLIDQILELHDAADALYMAGRWILSVDSGDGWDQAKLWEDLRSALGYEPGHSTEAGVNTAAVASGETVTMPSYVRKDDLVDSEEDATVSEVLNYHLEEIKSLLEGIE